MKKFFVLCLVAMMLCSAFVSCGETPEITTEPEITEAPEVTEPEVTEPEVTEPEITEPETTEPETAEPETTEPETEAPAPVVAPDAGTFTKMQSVLLLGQSNMVGNGWAKYVEPITDDRIYMMRGDEWVTMKEPLHEQTTKATVGLGASFAKAFVETFDCELGLIPVAVGGSSVLQWKKDYTGDKEHLYAKAIEMAKKAQETTEICAILWHQGETNRNRKAYAQDIKEIFDAFIEELGLNRDEIVIITGELGAWEGKEVELVNSALAAVEAEGYFPCYAVASQEGLTNVEKERSGSDSHFDSPSLRVFGYRYFEEFYEELMHRECAYVYSQNPDDYRIDPTA